MIIFYIFLLSINYFVELLKLNIKNRNHLFYSYYNY